jgi:hypothetical protein
MEGGAAIAAMNTVTGPKGESLRYIRGVSACLILREADENVISRLKLGFQIFQ